jgi:phosphatidate cytidylyltransferase
MSNLAQRLITGSIFVVVLVGCIWFSAFSFFLLLLAITILGLHEFYKLSRKAGADPQSNYGIVAGALMVTLSFIAVGSGFTTIFALIFPLVFLIFFIELYRKRANPFSNIGWTLLGLIYIALPMCMMITALVPGFYLIKFAQGAVHSSGIYDYGTVLLLFILIWVSDSMAYVCGRLFGKHKLWERISPKKTWEGFIGGAIFTIAVAGITVHLMQDGIHNRPWFFEMRWMAIGLIVSVTGMFGDLTESLFKRSIEVKDSGTILPGHGGILDRFDALFLAMPFAISLIWLTDNL